MNDPFDLVQFLRDILQLRQDLPDPAKRHEEKTGLGKLQTLFEKEVYDLARQWRWPIENVAIEVEGWSKVGSEDPEWIVYIDPTDGTAGDVGRSDFTHLLSSCLPVSCVVAIKKAGDPTFGGVKYAGAVDLYRDQIFCTDGEGAFVQWWHDSELVPLERKPQYDKRSPMVACEITRRANAFTRFLIGHGIAEFVSDSHSSFMVMLWSLLGYVDAWINFELPGVKGGGQRGHELGAIACFARALGATALDVRFYNDPGYRTSPLSETLWSFNGQTSVILAVDRETADFYLKMIYKNLWREVRIGNTIYLVAQVIEALHDQIQDTRWSFREISSSDK